MRSPLQQCPVSPEFISKKTIQSSGVVDNYITVFLFYDDVYYETLLVF